MKDTLLSFFEPSTFHVACAVIGTWISVFSSVSGAPYSNIGLAIAILPYAIGKGLAVIAYFLIGAFLVHKLVEAGMNPAELFSILDNGGVRIVEREDEEEEEQ
mgnify:CR=1 FL=1